MPKNQSPVRLTRHINRRVTQSIFRAVDYAQETGIPLNIYAVINFHERSELSAGTAFTRVRHKFRDWLGYNAIRHCMLRQLPAYVYSFENQDGLVHVNWMVHIPEKLQPAFQKKLHRWQERVVGKSGPFDVSVQPIDQGYAKKLAKYIVKGTDPSFVDHFYLNDVAADQGIIPGKRAGVSPSLGPTVRRAAGFKKPRRRFTIADVQPSRF